MAKCGDVALQKVAKLELTAPTAADPQVELADAWWELAKKATAVEKVSCQLRAGVWYRKAVGGLTGLAKARVQKRIDELDKLAAAVHGDGEETVEAVSKPVRRSPAFESAAWKSALVSEKPDFSPVLKPLLARDSRSGTSSRATRRGAFLLRRSRA